MISFAFFKKFSSHLNYITGITEFSIYFLLRFAQRVSSKQRFVQDLSNFNSSVLIFGGRFSESHPRSQLRSQLTIVTFSWNISNYGCVRFCWPRKSCVLISSSNFFWGSSRNYTRYPHKSLVVRCTVLQEFYLKSYNRFLQRCR